MGKGRDKRKKQKGSNTAGHGAAKTDRKTAQNEAKKDRRLAGADEDDIDAILAQLDVDSKKAHAVSIQAGCRPPAPRVCGLWVPTGDLRKDEILMFGGECWDKESGKVYVYDDIFTYDTSKSRWTRIVSRGPQPRSACSGTVYKGHLYMFGGEFTSPNQQKFKHYRDLWRLDLSSWQWEELSTKGGPTARSGHRMLCHQNKIWLFGGYYDTGDDLPKYYKDLWCFDPSALRWDSVGDMTARWPAARSGFQWVVHNDTLILHGGYSKQVDEDDKDMQHGVAMDDTWAWHIPTSKWEKKAKVGMAPSRRASFAMVKHKTRAILFGGTADEEAKDGEVLVSSFFNDLYQLNLEQWRWYPVVMRVKQQAAGEQMNQLKARVGTTMSDEEVKKVAAATRIQAHYRGHVVRKAMKLYRIGGQMSEVLYSPAAYGVDLSSQNAPKPRARINANICVVKNTLWLFGGIVEIGDREVTLDDVWSLDAVKLSGWQLIQDNSAGKEDFAEGGQESSQSDGSDDDA
eukprot:jgi/Ulvmu1/7035/UM033_0094.1